MSMNIEKNHLPCLAPFICRHHMSPNVEHKWYETIPGRRKLLSTSEAKYFVIIIRSQDIRFAVCTLTFCFLDIRDVLEEWFFSELHIHVKHSLLMRRFEQLIMPIVIAPASTVDDLFSGCSCESENTRSLFTLGAFCPQCSSAYCPTQYPDWIWNKNCSKYVNSPELSPQIRQ